jgi:hypothetical protein
VHRECTALAEPVADANQRHGSVGPSPERGFGPAYPLNGLKHNTQAAQCEHILFEDGRYPPAFQPRQHPPREVSHDRVVPVRHVQLVGDLALEARGPHGGRNHGAKQSPPIEGGGIVQQEETRVQVLRGGQKLSARDTELVLEQS